MTDVHNKATRSYNMSRIKSKNTGTELIVRKYLHARGFRYKLHDKMLPGKPDMIFPKYRTVILINGCFWHGHSSCKYYKIPKTRTDWWAAKISRNVENDKKNMATLLSLEWKVIIIWECDLKPAIFEKTMVSVITALSDRS